MTRQAGRAGNPGGWPAGALAVCLALALAACGSGGSESGPGGVSEGEAEALDDAAEMLDEQQLPTDAMPEVDLPAVEQAPGRESAGDAPAEGTGTQETGDSAE